MSYNRAIAREPVNPDARLEAQKWAYALAPILTGDAFMHWLEWSLKRRPTTPIGDMATPHDHPFCHMARWYFPASMAQVRFTVTTIPSLKTEKVTLYVTSVDDPMIAFSIHIIETKMLTVFRALTGAYFDWPILYPADAMGRCTAFVNRPSIWARFKLWLYSLFNR